MVKHCVGCVVRNIERDAAERTSQPPERETGHKVSLLRGGSGVIPGKGMHSHSDCSIKGRHTNCNRKTKRSSLVALVNSLAAEIQNIEQLSMPFLGACAELYSCSTRCFSSSLSCSRSLSLSLACQGVTSFVAYCPRVLVLSIRFVLPSPQSTKGEATIKSKRVPKGHKPVPRSGTGVLVMGRSSRVSDEANSQQCDLKLW